MTGKGVVLLFGDNTVLMESIKGKNILLVGATGGFGNKSAKLLAASGANLFIASRNKEKLDALTTEINLESGKSFAFDISHPEDGTALKEQFFHNSLLLMC